MPWAALTGARCGVTAATAVCVAKDSRSQPRTSTPSFYWPPTAENPDTMRADPATVPMPSPACSDDDTVCIVVKHETSVTDADADTRLAYLLQGAEGAIHRLGMIHHEALGNVHAGGVRLQA